MTRERAVEVLEQERAYLMGGPSPNLGEYDDAVKMAIAALMDQSELARNLHADASNQQVSDPLRPNGFLDSEESLATKNQVKSKWISVEDRLPEMKADVLVYFQNEKNMAVGFLCDVDEDRTMWCAYTDDGFYTDCDFEPSHWMPLPEPPKEER